MYNFLYKLSNLIISYIFIYTHKMTILNDWDYYELWRKCKTWLKVKEKKGLRMS